MTDKSKIPVRHEEIEEVLSSVPNKLIMNGNILVFSVLAVILTSSVFINFPTSITTSGVITTRNAPQIEYAKKTIKIEKLFVSDGDTVSAKDKLMLLQSSADYEYMLEVEKMLTDASQSIDALKSLIESYGQTHKLGDVVVSFNNLKHNVMQYSQEVSSSLLIEKIRVEKAIIEGLKKKYESQLSRRELLREKVAIYENIVNRNKRLLSEKVISSQEMEQVQLEYLNHQDLYEQTNYSIIDLKESIDTHTYTIEQLKAEHDEILNRLQVLVDNSINQVLTEIRQWKIEHLIISKVDGVVSFPEFSGTNKEIISGSTLFTVFPIEEQDYRVELSVPVNSSIHVKPGTKVVVELSNFPRTKYGVLEGEIEHISKVPNGSGIYTASVKLSDQNKNPKLMNEINQELACNIKVIGKDLSVFQRILERFIKI